MSATQSFKLTGLSASTTPIGPVLGGRYALVFAASGSGTAILNTLAADNATWVAVSSSITTTTSSQSLDLPPGQYQVVITGFTAASVSLTRCSI
jgi:hypothetical protein